MENYNPKKDVPLVLNSYDDLFSNFDPRPYSQRALSKDFLSECQKASEDKDKIKLNFFIPKNKRESLKEEKIKKRLKEHFYKHFLSNQKELFKIKTIGAVWFILGCVLIVLTAFFMERETSFLIKVLVNIAHPGGWFFLWEGLAKILIHSKEKKEDYNFNRKMKESEIFFLSNK